MIIAVDIDEVLFPFVPEIMRWHDRKYGTRLNIEQFASYQFWQAWGGTREQAIHKVIEYFLSADADQVLPFTDAKKTLENLKSFGIDLHIVTSRQLEVMPATIARIERHFPGIFNDIISVNHYSVSGKQSTKIAACRSVGAQLIIEDQIANAKECLAGGVNVIIYGQYPWNKVGLEGCPRVNNWAEVKDLLLDPTFSGS